MLGLGFDSIFDFSLKQVLHAMNERVKKFQRKPEKENKRKNFEALKSAVWI